MAARLIECEGGLGDGGTCGNTLGEWAAGYVVVRHRKREILCAPISITCEVCGWTWRPPDDSRRLAVQPVGDGESRLTRVS